VVANIGLVFLRIVRKRNAASRLVAVEEAKKRADAATWSIEEHMMTRGGSMCMLDVDSFTGRDRRISPSASVGTRDEPLEHFDWDAAANGDRSSEFGGVESNGSSLPASRAQLYPMEIEEGKNSFGLGFSGDANLNPSCSPRSSPSSGSIRPQPNHRLGSLGPTLPPPDLLHVHVGTSGRGGAPPRRGRSQPWQPPYLADGHESQLERGHTITEEADEDADGDGASGTTGRRQQRLEGRCSSVAIPEATRLSGSISTLDTVHGVPPRPTGSTISGTDSGSATNQHPVRITAAQLDNPISLDQLLGDSTDSE